MKRTRWIVKLSAVAVLIAIAGFGAFSLFTDAQAAGGCRCPLVYAPVLCDHGKIYPNPCEANCHNAKNCVPIGL
jgi:hypothetical protein